MQPRSRKMPINNAIFVIKPFKWPVVWIRSIAPQMSAPAWTACIAEPAADLSSVASRLISQAEYSGPRHSIQVR